MCQSCICIERQEFRFLLANYFWNKNKSSFVMNIYKQRSKDDLRLPWIHNHGDTDSSCLDQCNPSYLTYSWNRVSSLELLTSTIAWSIRNTAFNIHACTRKHSQHKNKIYGITTSDKIMGRAMLCKKIKAKNESFTNLKLYSVWIKVKHTTNMQIDHPDGSFTSSLDVTRYLSPQIGI